MSKFVTIGRGRRMLGSSHTSIGWQRQVPLSPTLARMANRLVHDKVIRKPIVRTGGGGKGKIKLSDTQCAEIRSLYEKGRPVSVIAKQFGLDTVDYVRKIAQGELRYKS